MKNNSLTILSSTLTTATAIKKQLIELFPDRINPSIAIINDKLELKSVYNHLVLISSNSIEKNAIKYIKPNTDYLVADRVIKFDNLDKLYLLQDYTDVLVINTTYPTCLEVLNQLKSSGIKNLNLHIYYPGIKNWNKDCTYALTFGEFKLIPKGNFQIIDLETRPLDITTCIKIANELHIYEDFKNTLSSMFLKSSVEIGQRYSKKLHENELMKNKLYQILNMIKAGVIVLDEDLNIIFFNQIAEHIFNIQNNKSDSLKNLTQKLLLKNAFFANINQYTYHIDIIKSFSEKNIILFINDFKKIEKIEKDYRDSIISNGLFAEYSFNDIIYFSKSMDSVVKEAKLFSKSDSTILVYGESGCGKELIVQSIHNNSSRSKEPFVAINFAAISDELCESVLFGYTEGAFTGAKKGGKIGLFELAHKGTIFLDEIGDASLETQKKILRVIQEKKVLPIGGTKLVPVDIRIIAATNQDLYVLVHEKKFREDLFYRLNVLPIIVPPLRNRKLDIIPLFKYFLFESFKCKELVLSNKLVNLLKNYDWHGNIRELKNIAEYTSNFIKLGCDWETKLEQALYINKRKISECNTNKMIELAKVVENSLNIHVVCSILSILNSPPYKWTRKSIYKFMLNSEIELSESQIKRVLIIMKKIGLIESKNGSGTNIKSLGIQLLEYYQ